MHEDGGTGTERAVTSDHREIARFPGGHRPPRRLARVDHVNGAVLKAVVRRPYVFGRSIGCPEGSPLTNRGRRRRAGGTRRSVPDGRRVRTSYDLANLPDPVTETDPERRAPRSAPTAFSRRRSSTPTSGTRRSQSAGGRVGANGVRDAVGRRAGDSEDVTDGRSHRPEPRRARHRLVYFYEHFMGGSPNTDTVAVRDWATKRNSSSHQ